MHSLQLGTWIAALALLSSVGCVSTYPHVYCAPEVCHGCNPEIGRPSCDHCGSENCQMTCGKPARGLFTHLGYMATCGGGCGEFYIHPWINERPDCCDPCEDHGNWIGPGNCCNRGFWNSFWGNKPCGSQCGTCASAPGCGCDSCAGGSVAVPQGEIMVPEGEVYYENVPAMKQPTPAPVPAPAPEAAIGPAARKPTPAVGSGVRQR